MSIRWEDGVVILEGEFDLANQQLIRSAIGAAIGHGAAELTINMAGVTFCDASSMGVLIEATRLDLEVRILDPSEIARKVLRLTHVDELVAVIDI